MNRGIFYLLFHPHGDVPDYVLYKLAKLRPFANYIRVIVNGDLSTENRSRLEAVSDFVHVRANTGLDVGAYQDAIREFGFENLAQFDELILMNYTWYGPINSFDDVFKRMDSEKVDFWGMTEHGQVTPNPITGHGVMARHLQSHWIAVRKSLLGSKYWREYWENMPKIRDYQESILLHESRFTSYFNQLNFSSIAAFPLADYDTDHPAFINANALMLNGCPVLKRRPFFHDPLYLDAEAIIGRDLIETAHALGYPTELIWSDIVPLTEPKILNTNTSQLEVLSSQADSGKPYVGKIAAVVHVFYEEMIYELLDKISFIPGDVDLIITTTDKQKGEFIQRALLESYPSEKFTDIRILDSNRGRDLSAYFIACRDIVTDEKYDLIVKIHSKKTVQRGSTAGDFFKRQQIENLLYTPGYVRNLVNLFEQDPQLGIVFPPTIHTGYPTLGMAWFANKEPAKAYADDIGIRVPFDDVSPLGALGAMWICRPRALKKMTDVKYDYSDYSSEGNHGDGSLAHVQERMVAYAAAEIGMKTKTVANSDYISISHAFLEYKLDQALAAMPGYALHSVPKMRHEIANGRVQVSEFSRNQFVKSYLVVHHPKTGKFLRWLYLPIRKVKRRLLGFE